MSGLNSNGLTVYLSKNLSTPEEVVSSCRKNLQELGYTVREYQVGTTYSDHLLRSSDFVVFLPKSPGEIALIRNNNGRADYRHFVGKGQFTEAQLCKKIGKPAFVIHQETWEGHYTDYMVSKLVDEHNPNYGNLNHSIYDTNDWKMKFGTIASYSKGNLLVNLSHFIDGYFASNKLESKIFMYPLTPSEAFKLPNPQLLLL